MPRQSLDDIIVDAAVKNSLDPNYMRRVAKIESGMNPNAHDRGSSYHGLFQLGGREFANNGGRGNIYDPVQNANAAATMMAKQEAAFTAKYGRPPDDTERYMIHQQGEGGLDAHLANPNQPAWMSMWSTGEGQQKGQGWAKQAIWGNIPDNLKQQFGNVNNVTSSDFINLVWRPKFEGPDATEGPATGSPPGLPVQAEDRAKTMLAAATGSPVGMPEGYTATGAGSLQARTIAGLDLGTSPPSAANKAATGLGGLGFGGPFQTGAFPLAGASSGTTPIPTQLASLPPSLLAKYMPGRR